MNALTLHLQSAAQQERVEGVASFVGEDDSGSFGILPGHARMMTVMSYGLARFRRQQGDWEYLALPGGVLYCLDERLYVCTRRYLRGADYTLIQQALRQELLEEEHRLRGIREHLRQLEHEMIKRLWQVRQLPRGVS